MNKAFSYQIRVTDMKTLKDFLIGIEASNADEALDTVTSMVKDPDKYWFVFERIIARKDIKAGGNPYLGVREGYGEFVKATTDDILRELAMSY